MPGDERLTRLLNVNEVAKLLGASPYTVRAWIRQRLLLATKLGRMVRIEQRELERFIQESRV